MINESPFQSFVDNMTPDSGLLRRITFLGTLCLTFHDFQILGVLVFERENLRAIQKQESRIEK